MKNRVDFITADGGFDFSIDFNNQENMAVRLYIYRNYLCNINAEKRWFVCNKNVRYIP